MNHQELVEWLFSHGGPSIRYRTATELMSHCPDTLIERLREELNQSHLVRTWLTKFIPPSYLNDLHGSKATAFETVMGKLTDLGLRRGNSEIDRRTAPYREWLQSNPEFTAPHIFDLFGRTLVAAFLARAGYTDEPAVGKVLRNRLERIYGYTREGRYDIYVDSKDHPRTPGSFRDRPLIKPELSAGGNLSLPWIYDIIGLAAYLPEHGTPKDRAKADAIINYILDTRYQQLADGYGILLGDNGRYYAMGWSAHLPGFIDDSSGHVEPHSAPPQILGAFVQRLVLLGQFPAARKHPWFSGGIRHLEEFQTGKGTYIFPRSYLPEKPSGYWVSGARMGLEESRRTGLSLELESTFWMSKLKSLLPG